MPFPQISQVLCISGVLGALYLPDSTSSGRRPHLNIVIKCLLLVDILLIYGVGGPAVPPDQMSPRTRGPRTRCPPGHVVLGPDVPRQDGMSPPFNAQSSLCFNVRAKRWD